MFDMMASSIMHLGMPNFICHFFRHVRSHCKMAVLLLEISGQYRMQSLNSGLAGRSFM